MLKRGILKSRFNSYFLNQVRTFALPPHGPKGVLVNLLQEGSALDAIKEECLTLPEVVLSKRQLCDIELLLNGAFSPLDGFMNKADYDNVCANMRLADGTLWPMPITLDIPDDKVDAVKAAGSVVLKDWE